MTTSQPFSHAQFPQHTPITVVHRGGHPAQRVASLLTKAGANDTALACGSHLPYFYSTNNITPEAGAVFGRLHHNCSGKHTGMLLLAAALGEPMTGYLNTDHPVQQAITASVSHFTGVPQEQLVHGTDGCSAPNYAVPLPALASAFARLTLTEPDTEYGQGPQRVAQAMCTHPDMVSGHKVATTWPWPAQVGATGCAKWGQMACRPSPAAAGASPWSQK